MECKEFYRAGSLIAVLRELARYELDLVGVQEVEVYTFFYGKGNDKHKLRTGFLCMRE
jgi:mRNA deadenylase 3'-5' endonuclease subunit Ccr4